MSVVVKYVSMFFVKRRNNFKIIEAGIDQSIKSYSYKPIVAIQIQFKSKTILYKDIDKFSRIEEIYKFLQIC